jgi:hypothetical protein
MSNSLILPSKEIISPQSIERMTENEHLGLPLDFDDSTVHNILLDNDHASLFRGDSILEIIDIMSKPEYFYYTCKWLLNINLLPFQLVMLQELWERKFPMIIASRGGGKCVTGDTLIQLWDRFSQIGDFIGNKSECGIPQYSKINGVMCFGENGYNSIEYGWNNGYGKTKRIFTDIGMELSGVPQHKIRILRNDTVCWVELGDIVVGDYAILDRSGVWHNGDNGLSEEDAYELGQSFGVNISEKLPSAILGCGKKAAEKFCTAFMKSSYRHKNKSAAQAMQFIFLKLGHIARILKTDESRHYLYFNPEDNEGIVSPIFLAKITAIEDGFEQTFDVHIPNDHSFISNGFISHNTWILSLYALLRGIFNQGSKIILAGAGFRQSKLMFEYMEGFWRGAPILRHLVGDGKRQGPKRNIDRCNFYLGESDVIAIPLGNGNTIRGLRANYTICDEFASVPIDVFEVVIRGFSSVSSSPEKRSRDMAKIRVLKQLGMDAEAEDIDTGYGNQIVISGTPYYAFNHFYDYWSKYKEIIQSKGDKKILEGIFRGEVPGDFDWKQYSIFRIPWHVIPKGFMDETQIYQAKATIKHSSIYQMEYGACLDKDVPIITDNGVKRIIDVTTEDRVLTHEGRFRKVIKKTRRKYDDKIVKYACNGSYTNNKITPEHPFWNGNDFSTLREIPCCKLSALKELSGLSSISVPSVIGNSENYLSDMYIENDHYIYHRSSHNLLSNRQVQRIFELYKQGLSQNKLARRFKTTQQRISLILNQIRPNTAVNRDIPLDYHFGFLLGCLAAYKKRYRGKYCTAFVIKGEKIEKLEIAIERILGIVPTIYDYKSGLCRMSINSLAFRDLTEALYNNGVFTHDILFSNKEVLAGFLSAICEKYRKNTTVKSSNKNTLCQVRLAFSFFGFNAMPTKKDELYIGPIDIEQLIDFNRQEDTSDKFHYDFYEKRLVPYKGMVYNLEVEEDHSYSTIDATIHNCFPKDSDGFFKRSLIESCVCNNPIELPSGPVQFSAVTRGQPNSHYVYGIDPASENDNFAIIILEVFPDHRRIVYCWTINRQKMKERIKNRGESSDRSFYTYCARKIRELMKIFPTDHIGIDAQGGGVAIMEALHDPNECNYGIGESLIWPYIKQGDNDVYWWEKANKDTDGKPGLHILHMVQFANADFTSDANHGMRKDFESKMTIFPFFDSVTLSESVSLDAINDRQYDTLEDCVMEIEDLKDELATIMHDQTSLGRDRWDTPSIKLPGSKSGRLRKDRYSALLIANMLVRVCDNKIPEIEYNFIGGYAGQKRQDVNSTKMYVGPEHIVSQMNASIYKGISKNR